MWPVRECRSPVRHKLHAINTVPFLGLHLYQQCNAGHHNATRGTQSMANSLYPHVAYTRLADSEVVMMRVFGSVA
jgi:hypothetical protein